MRVLKFGGTSVGSIQNIQKVIKIVAKEAQKHRLAVVVSAIGGITNKLVEAGTLAQQKEESYQQCFQDIRTQHLTFAKTLTTHNPVTLNTVTALMNDLEALLHGIYLIHET